MRFIERVRFLIGLVLVVIIIGVLFLILNYSMSNKYSHEATLEADAYEVTSDYAGVLRRQFVSAGDQVNEGDRLFEINSPSMNQAIKDERIDEDNLLFEITDSGNMILLANAPGTVQHINFVVGSYVEAKRSVATISTDNARYVVAKYLLNAPDYARINRDNTVKVTLPDNSKYEAEIFDITLEKDGEQIFTIVRARLPEDADILPTFTSGTPVSTSWQLENSDWQDVLFKFVKSLTEPQTKG